jgi:hypothetical protein
MPPPGALNPLPDPMFPLESELLLGTEPIPEPAPIPELDPVPEAGADPLWEPLDLSLGFQPLPGTPCVPEEPA